MVFYGKEVENKVRWGIGRCVSKVDKHVDDVDKWWKILRCEDYLQPENGGIVWKTEKIWREECKIM